MLHFIYDLLNRLSRNWFLICNRSRFKRFGKKSRVYKPVLVKGMENISIGDNVIVQEGTWLAAQPLTGELCSLIINSGTRTGHYNHIFATHSIVIDSDVLLADKVYISDNLHCYEDVSLPVIKQPIKQCKPVLIGEGSWIGENVCVIGASIGRHCIIGANAVVTKDIPDYSIAIGAPARVIKRYDTCYMNGCPFQTNNIKY